MKKMDTVENENIWSNSAFLKSSYVLPQEGRQDCAG